MPLGKEYEIRVTASNRINTLTTNASFRIVDRIKSHRLHVERQVAKGAPLYIAVNVVEGTEVFLEILFGDGNRSSHLIDDARSTDVSDDGGAYVGEGGVWYNITHR